MDKATHSPELEPAPLPPDRTTAHQRVRAAASVSFKSDRDGTRLDRLYQQGNAKIRFPRMPDRSKEAVLINTAGGLTGGDELDWDIALGPRAKVTATTQACEKIYRSAGGAARIGASISLAPGAQLHWLLQETIVFDGSSLSRTLDADLAPDSRLVAFEAVVLGRLAMAERVSRCALCERWRIRRAGALVHADDVKLRGPVGEVEREPALLDAHRAFATLAYLGPDGDDQLAAKADRLRAVANSPTVGVSAFAGKIVARFLARDGYALRQAVVPVLERLCGDLPAVWRI